MANPTLTAIWPLTGKHITSPTFKATPVALTLISLQSQHGKAAALADAVQQHCKVPLPQRGQWTSGEGLILSWGGHEQWFASASQETPHGFTQHMYQALGHCAAITDQSDAWVQINLKGTACYTVLERLCPLDLHPSVFPPGCVARTVMEHLGVQIMAMSGLPEFILLTPSSSAQSFWTALEHAAASGY